MVGPNELYLFDVVCRFEQYLEADSDEAEQLIRAVPQEMIKELQGRFLQLLLGHDARKVLELPGYRGGRPTKSFRNFFIALDYQVLRNEGESYAPTIKILEDRWNIRGTTLKSAISEFNDDEELQLIAKLSRNWLNRHTLMSIAEKLSKLPPVV